MPMKASASSFLFILLLCFAEFHSASATVKSSTAHHENSSCTNVCFAIDGSKSISSKDFDHQIALAREITRRVPSKQNPRFAAVQYGVINTPISPLSTARFSVMKAIRETTQQRSPGTFIAGAISYCFSELFDIETELLICPKSVIVVMGDGSGNIGIDPAERGGLFEEKGGNVIAVAFGSKANKKLLMDLGGANGFFDGDKEGIRKIAQNILKISGI